MHMKIHTRAYMAFLVDGLPKKYLISLAEKRGKDIPEAANTKPPTLLRHVKIMIKFIKAKLCLYNSPTAKYWQSIQGQMP